MLLDLPNVVLNEVLDASDFRSILILRKVCHSLRDYIDTEVPDAKLTSLELSVQDEDVIVRYGTCGRYRYGVHENGCYVEEEDGETRVLENQNYLETFFNDLKIVLKHQKSEMDLFDLLRRHSPSYDCSPFLATLKTILESRPEFLKTKRFHPSVLNQNELMETLPYLNPDHLKEAFILHTRTEEPETFSEIDQLVELEQWKKLEKIAIPAFNVSGAALRHFVHFRQFLVFMEKLTSEDLEFLKETFLQSPTFENVDFNYKEYDGQEEDFSDVFGIPLVDENESSWYFKFPNSEDILAIVHMKLEFPRFDIFRMSPDRVPAGAIVQ
ncbi:unnamed protein product [Caenorhabditis brenneri]